MAENVPIQLLHTERGARLHVQTFALDAQPSRPIAALDGRPLPGAVGDTVQGVARALCIGPTEWLLVSSEMSVERLQSEMAEEGFAVVDLSDGLVTLEVSGAASRTLLAKGCGLDLHPRQFQAGRCARTPLADLSVVVDCIDDSGCFNLHVSRSYAVYLLDWLADAASCYR